MDWGILILLFAMAWGLRSIGLDWGYFHGDERVNQAAKVLAGQIVPDQHFYPPLMHYLAAVLYAGLYGFGKVFGFWTDAGAFRAAYFQDPTIFYLVARAMTGAFAALMAPMFYRISRLLGFERGESFCVAAFAVFAPLSIFLSYLFKGDVAMASATILTVLLILQKSLTPESRRLDVFLGVAVVLGLSFKHSFVFLMLPFAVGYGAVMLGRIGAAGTFSSFARILTTAIILWPVLNIGIVLDLPGFLKFQEIQTVMSISNSTEASFWDALGKMWRAATSWDFGLAFLMPYAFLIFPIFALGMDRPGMLLALWGAVILSGLVVTYLVGLRQPEQLWIAHFMVVQLFGALSIICIYRLSRTVGMLAGIAALSFCIIGDVTIWKQTLVRPLNQDVATFVQTVFPDRKVMSNIVLPIQKSGEAMAFERARDVRAAQKYGLALPEVAPERQAAVDAQEGSFVVAMPEVMFGLEGSVDADLGSNVALFAWPPQVEDWQLSALVASGIDIFVVRELSVWVQRDYAPVLQAFYQDLQRHCKSVQVFISRKPLFLERDTSVMDCRGAFGSS